jgi:HKD family nuclease
MQPTPSRAAKRARPASSSGPVDTLESKRYIGKISAFYPAKGYGFIKSPDLLDEMDQDAMVLASEKGTFRVADEVSFQISINGSGKLKAHNLGFASAEPGPKADLSLCSKRSTKQAVQVLMNESSGAEAIRMWQALLKQAQGTIRIAAFGLDRDMLEHLYMAARRGVKIWLLIDFDHQINETNLPCVLDIFANLEVRYTSSTTRLHAKTLIVDPEETSRSAMVTGSANATRFSRTSIEWVMFCKMFDGCSVSARYLIEDSAREFDHLWHHGEWLDAPTPLGSTASPIC